MTGLYLQPLFHQCCDEIRQWYGMPTGYQRQAADMVSERTHRRIVEDEKLWRIAKERWPAPDGIEWASVVVVLHSLVPTFVGYSKQFYVLRDVAVALRHIPKVKCAECSRRYNRTAAEYREFDLNEKWRCFPEWTCSNKCFRMARRKFDRLEREIQKEKRWLTIARGRLTEVHNYLKQQTPRDA